MGSTSKKVIKNIIFLLVCIIIAYALSNYLFTAIEVKGDSMETTLHSEDMILIFKPGKYKFGDVIVFNSHKQTQEGEQHLVKRIIGLPGDTVEVIKDEGDGKFYVWRNGEKLSEDYTNPAYPMLEEMARITVPDGKFLYMGDNRGMSSDSRRTGELGRLDSINGRVILRYVIQSDKKWEMAGIKRL